MALKELLIRWKAIYLPCNVNWCLPGLHSSLFMIWCSRMQSIWTNLKLFVMKSQVYRIISSHQYVALILTPSSLESRVQAFVVRFHCSPEAVISWVVCRQSKQTKTPQHERGLNHCNGTFLFLAHKFIGIVNRKNISNFSDLINFSQTGIITNFYS